MLAPIIHGFLLALGLILPLGVQNVFIFQQGATQPKFIKSLPAVITASLCDTLLILLAVLGISVLVLENEWIKIILLTVGIGFLLYMGTITWKSRPRMDTHHGMGAISSQKQIIFAMSVSLLNPHAIIDTVGVIGTSALSYEGIDKMLFAASCILVSWLWFTGLAIVGRMTGKLDPSGTFLILLNKISALIMWGTAIYIGIHLFQTLILLA